MISGSKNEFPRGSHRVLAYKVRLGRSGRLGRLGRLGRKTLWLFFFFFFSFQRLLPMTRTSSIHPSIHPSSHLSIHRLLNAIIPSINPSHPVTSPITTTATTAAALPLPYLARVAPHYSHLLTYLLYIIVRKDVTG